MKLEVPFVQRQKIEVIGGHALVQGIDRDIEKTFLKYESDTPECQSVFEELIGKKRDRKVTIGEEQRQSMLKEFDGIYKRTGLSKLKQIIEMCNILLESKLLLSFHLYRPYQFYIHSLPPNHLGCGQGVLE
jgi:hypothetical protein